MFKIIIAGLLFASANLQFLFSRTYHKGPLSDHFDGRRFRNFPLRYRTIGQLLKWFATRAAKPWPKWREIPSFAKPMVRVAKDELVVTFVNHSTVLIQWDGVNLLTDPVWSEYAGPMKGIGPKRRHLPGIPFEDLPPIDIVLLSHNHYDHMDLKTLKRLFKKFKPQIITGLGNGVYLKAKGISHVHELDWWQDLKTHQGFKITYVPAQHFSARFPWDHNKALWGGFTVMSDTGLLYFAGDTGSGGHFEEIKKRIGSPRLALLPIGAFEPRWFMQAAHMSPQDAVQVHRNLEAQTSLAIHHGTFRLSDEGIDDPMKELKRELHDQHIDESKFWVLQPGQSRKVP